MRWSVRWLLSFCGMLFLLLAASGDALGQTGIVKGRITIGGKPTSDVAVSVEGLPDKYLKSQISNPRTR